MAFGIDDAVAVGLKLIDKWFPSQTEKDAAKLDLLKMQMDGEFKWLAAIQGSDAGQVSTNNIEAASPDLFKSGWRPFIGWTCGIALAFQWVGRDVLLWVVALMGKTIIPPPSFDTAQVMGLLVPMLGLGAYRTYEKIKGAS